MKQIYIKSLLFALLTWLLIVNPACKKGNYSAGEDDTVHISSVGTEVNPGNTLALSITGIKANGHPMPDNTLVRLTVDLGELLNIAMQRIEGVVLISGKAEALYKAPTKLEGGVANIKATCGSAKVSPETLTILIHNLDLAQLVITVKKDKPVNNVGTAVITVAALNINGNPIQGQTISLETTAGTFSDPVTQQTDSNGQISNTLTYSETATVTATCKDISKEVTVDMEINLPPKADFAFSPQNPVNGEIVYFNSLSSDPEGKQLTYKWNFGDGKEANGESVPHIFPRVQEEKEFQVIHTVTDEDGATATVVKGVKIALKKKPVADFTFYITPFDRLPANVDVQFSNQSVPGDAPIVKYAWVFGDNNTDASENPSHTYENIIIPTTFTVQLTITDENQLTSSVTKPVAIGNSANKPPKADFTFEPLQPEPNEWIQLISKATDEDGTIEKHEWKIEAHEDSTKVNPNIKYSKTGEFVVQLTVTDNENASSSVSKSITVAKKNTLPVADFVITPSSTEVGKTVNFDAGKSYDPDPDGRIVKYSWDLGDGTIKEDKIVNHSYEKDDTYTVILTVTDDRGGTNTKKETVKVEAADPSRGAK